MFGMGYLGAPMTVGPSLGKILAMPLLLDIAHEVRYRAAEVRTVGVAHSFSA